MRLWDRATRDKPDRILRGHTDEVNWVSFSPDGRTLATASDDQTVKTLGCSHRRVMATLAGHCEPVVAAIFSPDGRQVISRRRREK